ncbi:TerB family tellurite resistance protein [Sulfidibacter corallicola]|uniref:TerB family tellurite resistance protein n=1 Tax=Sulfidibacter corallicola TaxID=2818388 RepID=A0A8A4TYJ9_SULCO|nr:TerB family tellurite resistance protein [Sulfidibacter corallicola]QTD54308.1 TerB family tellurite resistance protein [Sulfidibacter corallicola]
MSLFTRLLDMFSNEPEQQEADDPLLVRAALLLETACFDDDFAPSERQLIVRLLEHKYQLEPSEIKELFETANQRRSERHDIFVFTNRINEVLSLEERAELMTEIWQVIFADDKVTPEEEHLARRLRTLLRLDHQHWAKAKQDARIRNKESTPES